MILDEHNEQTALSEGLGNKINVGDLTKGYQNVSLTEVVSIGADLGVAKTIKVLDVFGELSNLVSQRSKNVKQAITEMKANGVSEDEIEIFIQTNNPDDLTEDDIRDAITRVFGSDVANKIDLNCDDVMGVLSNMFLALGLDVSAYAGIMQKFANGYKNE